MNKIIVGLAFMVMATAAVHAQQPDQPQLQKHQQHARHHGQDGLAKKLNFSDQQKQQLESIRSDYHKKMILLKKNQDITVRASNTQKKALRTDFRAQVQALLTPEQKNQLAKMKQERMETAKVNATARAAKMKIKLGLTDAQAGQLKTLRTDMVNKIKSIHIDNTLSQEQKREQVKSLVQQQKEQLKTVLTADQLQQLEQMKAQRHRREFSR